MQNFAYKSNPPKACALIYLYIQLSHVHGHRNANLHSLCRAVWSDSEREDFVDWISKNPEAGDVIAATGGLRKVRWSRQGMGKRGGSRVIYFNKLESGFIRLLIVYTKTKFDDLPTEYLKRLKEQYDV